MTWTNYEPPAELIARLGLPAWVPVRTERLPDIAPGGEVDLATLAEELDHVCDRQPEWVERLTPAIVTATSIASDEALSLGTPDEAERLARIGLRYRPDDPGLLARVDAARGTGTDVAPVLAPFEEPEPAPLDRPVSDDDPEPATAPPTGTRRALAVAVAVLVVVGVAGIAWFAFDDDDGETAVVAPSTTEAPTTSDGPTTTEAAPTTTAPTTTAPTTTEAATTTSAATDPTDVVVPEVSGLTEADAVALLEDAGLVVTVVDEPTAEAPPGTVIGSDPPFGDSLAAGGAITLTVARRPAECNDAPAEIRTARFGDVADLGAEATDAIDWAVAVGLVSPASRFGPRDPMSRGAAVTVLWRYLCSPLATQAPQAFTDVPADAFFADAVAWASGFDIVGGTSATTFSPDEPISRGAFVTMVWRALGEPAPSGDAPFTDVADSAFYAPAVRWAYEQQLVGGTTPTTFSPDAVLDRITTIVLFDRLERRLDPLVGSLPSHS